MTDDAVTPVNGEPVSPPPPPEPVPATAAGPYPEAESAPPYAVAPPEPPLQYPEQLSGRIINELV